MHRSCLQVIRGGAANKTTRYVHDADDAGHAPEVIFRRTLLGYYALTIVDAVDYLVGRVPEEPGLEWSETVRILQRVVTSFEDLSLVETVDLLEQRSQAGDATASYHCVTVDYARRALRGFNGGLQGVLAETPEDIVALWKDVSSAVRQLSGWFKPRLVS